MLTVNIFLRSRRHERFKPDYSGSEYDDFNYHFDVEKRFREIAGQTKQPKRIIDRGNKL